VFADESGFMLIPNVVRTILRSIDGIRSSPQKLYGCILQSDLPSLLRQSVTLFMQRSIRNIARGKSGGIATAWAWCTNRHYRSARASIPQHRTAGRAGAKQLFAELSAVAVEHRPSSCARCWLRLASMYAQYEPFGSDVARLR